MSFLTGFLRRTTVKDDSQVHDLILRALVDLTEKVDSMRQGLRNFRTEHLEDWQVFYRNELNEIRDAIKNSGPSQAADIAKVCLDRMAQVATGRAPQPSMPFSWVEPPLPKYAIPVAEEDWADGADEMALKG